jgi:CBS-domain-containing membrane protein
MMLLREKVTELPVVDDNGTLIGQVNTTEIIVAHLNMKYQDLT